MLGGKSPFEMIHNKLPVFDNLRVFGCLCFATKLNNNDKLIERSEKCVFIGYSNEKKGYKCLSLDNSSIFFSRDVKFYEDIFPFNMQNVHQDYNGEDEFYRSKFFSIFSDGVVNPDDDNLICTHSNRTDTSESRTSSRNGTSDSNQSSEPGLERHMLLTVFSSDVPSLEAVHDETSVPEGNGSSNQSPSSVSLLGTQTRSRREVRLLTRYNDFVVEGKYKYGIEKSVNYLKLNTEIFCFTSNLNKN